MLKVSSKLRQKSLSSLVQPHVFSRNFSSAAAKPEKVTTVMCVNRGEIAIRVYRAAHELGFNSVGVYSDVDSNSLHRFKAQKSFLLNTNKSAVAQYLDIDGLIENNVDIIHPGYGFLAENAQFATKVEQNGMLYAGPPGDVVDFFGDKVKSKHYLLSLNSFPNPG